MPFTELGLPAALVKAVKAAGYVEPMPIQRRAIPIILAGGDMIGAAQTGTGKTAAFILPLLARLMDGTPGLRALVLTPTRELAAQVESNARDYAKFTRLRVAAVYGGVPLPPQERLLRREGVDLLVATPGRLLDLHGRQSVTFEDIESLVLDEADRMVDMGFAPDLKRILALLPRDRQTLMFSATMPPELNRVAREALYEPVRVDLAPPSRPAAGIAQAVYPVPRNLKTDLLSELLSRTERRSVIVFARTKRGAERLSRQLKQRGHAVGVMHGDRSQSQRERALNDLRRGRVQIMVATDIASRGIDVDDISHVINYDVPHTPEDYVHRIGRTGRVGASGDAFTLMSLDEKKDLEAIERFLGRSLPRVMMPDFNYHMRPAEISNAVRGADPSAPRRHAPHHAGDSGGRPAAASPPAPAGPVHGRRVRRSSPTDRRNRRRM
jgi:ATP-dependent RNA helicase RhlE